MGSSPRFQIQDSPNAVGFSSLLPSTQQLLNQGTQAAFFNNTEVGERSRASRLLPGAAGTLIYLRRVKTSSFHLSLPLKPEVRKPAGHRTADQTLIKATLQQLERRCSI